jgi:hypothetical protein
MNTDPEYNKYLELRGMVSFDDADSANLVHARGLFEQHGAELTDAFYSVLLANKETAALIEGRVEGLKKTHNLWLLSMCSGSYGRAFFDRQFHIGMVHVNHGIPPWFVSVVMNIVRVQARRLFYAHLPADQAGPTTDSLMKAVDLVGLVMDMGYAEARMRRIANVTRMSRDLILSLVEGNGADQEAKGFL